MKELYAWVPWFNGLAKRISNGGERELTERAAQVKWGESAQTPPLLRYGPEMVDPFSFIYSLASRCRSRTNRVRIIQSTAAVFDLDHEFPSSLDDAFYFPQSKQGTPVFHKDGEGDPGMLWDLFRHAVEGIDAVPGKVFDDALKIKNVGPPKLTQALFLVDAHAFLPYDKATRPLLSGRSSEKLNWTSYRAAIDELAEQFPGCEPYEISLFGYLAQPKETGAIGRNVYQVSTNVRGDGVDQWEDFERNHWIYTGGVASGKGFDQIDKAARGKHFPLQEPDRGDLVLVRTSGEGKAMAIVWRNDYGRELEDETRMHVLWLNKLKAPLGFSRGPGFSRAHGIERAFRRRDEYRPTFVVLDQLRFSDGLTKAAILETLEEYDRLGRDGFLRRYGYAGARTRWIHHGENRYDMKPIWRAAFAHMEGGHALTPKDEKYETNSDSVQRHLQHLGFIVISALGGNLGPVVDQPLNQILYGPPGTGKTWRTVSVALAIVDGEQDSSHDLNRFNRLRFNAERGSGNIAMVTFHQNFAYEDFVEGIRPVLDSDQGLRYELHEGLFKRIANSAAERPDERFVLIVDEINRGNIARIFGELITLIEDSRRTGREEETWVSLPYSQQRFGVPGNLYVVGTMNTADRSIQLLDTALRRRFTFIEMMPDYRELTTVEGVDCALMLRTMNDRIAVLLDREHQIGHTYLLNLRSTEDLAHCFRNQLFPLLQEYFFDDWSKIKVVLGKSPFVSERPGNSVVENPKFIDEDRKLFERLPDDDPKWTSMDGFRSIYEGAPHTTEEN